MQIPLQLHDVLKKEEERRKGMKKKGRIREEEDNELVRFTVDGPRGQRNEERIREVRKIVEGYVIKSGIEYGSGYRLSTPFSFWYHCASVYESRIDPSCLKTALLHYQFPLKTLCVAEISQAHPVYSLLSFSLPLCLFLASLSHLHMNPNWAWGMVGGWPPLREMIVLDEEEEKLPYREIGIRVAYTPAAALQISVTNNFLIFHITEHFGNWWIFFFFFFYRDEERGFILLWNDAAGDIRRTSVIYNDTTSKHIRYSRINVVCYSLLARVRVRSDVRLSCNNFLYDEWTSNEQPWGVINCRVCKNDTLLQALELLVHLRMQYLV